MGGWDPRKTHQPPPKERNPQSEGTDEAKTKHESPEPTANANEPQEPEPPAPRGQEEEGSKPDGHEPDGNETHKPPALTADTTAAERHANAARPEPQQPEETEKTDAPGKQPRASASAPEAHPTNTEAEEETPAAAKHKAEAATPPKRREPEKPTDENEPTKRRNKANATVAARRTTRTRRARTGKQRRGVEQGTDTSQPPTPERTATNGNAQRPQANARNRDATVNEPNETTVTQPEKERAERRTEQEAHEN